MLNKKIFKYIVSVLYLVFLFNFEVYTKDYKLTILYTNDEHGYIESDSLNSGAANLFEIWKRSYITNENTLILSGGDNFAAAPPLSMETKGKSTIDVFKEMGYQASAIGNHEFDFGSSVLRELIIRSNFDYLSANLVNRLTDSLPDYSKPYIIKKFNGFNVGIIGLANIETPTLTHPSNIKGLILKSYEETLLKYLPEMDKNSDLIIVLIHDCSEKIIENSNLQYIFDKYHVCFVGTGHCHQLFNQKLKNTLIVEASSNLKNFAKIDIVFNSDKNEVINSKSEIIPNKKIERSLNKIDTIIEYYNKDLVILREQLGKKIAYLNKDYLKGTDELYSFIGKAWFDYFPDTDVVIMNRGSIRYDLKKGDINISKLKMMMPFENEIFYTEISGKNLILELSNKKLIGLLNQNLVQVYHDSNQIDPEKTYRLLLPDFVFNGGDNCTIKKVSEKVIGKNINYSIPVIEYFKKYQIVE